MPYQVWVCDGCEKPQKRRDAIWDCPGCKKEVCDSCFDRYAHCKTCSKGRTDEQLREAANQEDWGSVI